MTLPIGHQFTDDEDVMRRALATAAAGIGSVEPNPAVAAVITDDALRFTAEGRHEQFGGPHAEVNAIAAAEGQTEGRQLFVTLEPCSHHGKTPPCADAVIAAGFRRVVIGCEDPVSHTDTRGIAKLKAAGIDVVVGVCESEAQQLIAPFRRLMTDGRPWVHAKWAMTLDGRIAARTGHSKWITNEDSRAEVHRLRGRMDAVITGAGTVRTDNPTLTARPPGPRTALRVVVDTDGTSVRPDGNLLQTIDQAPVLICISEQHTGSEHVQKLTQAGAEVLVTSGDRQNAATQLLEELGRRRMTNVLVEAGAGLLGTFFDAGLIDEVHAFVAPKLVGGAEAVSPVGGRGLDPTPALSSLVGRQIREFGEDILIEGRICR